MTAKLSTGLRVHLPSLSSRSRGETLPSRLGALTWAIAALLLVGCSATANTPASHTKPKPNAAATSAPSSSGRWLRPAKSGLAFRCTKESDGVTHHWTFTPTVAMYRSEADGQAVSTPRHIDNLQWQADGGANFLIEAEGVLVELKNNYGCIGPVVIRSKRAGVPSQRLIACNNADHKPAFHETCMSNVRATMAACPQPRQPGGGSCAGGSVWSRSSEGACCEYASSCAAPQGWTSFDNEQTCESGLGIRR